MAVVDGGVATWLKNEARFVSTVVAGAAAAWGTKGVNGTVISPVALQADAQTECNRQASFLAGPIARDRHVVKGARRDLVGKVVTMQSDRLGYLTTGTNVYVIGADETSVPGMTVLSVLKRL